MESFTYRYNKIENEISEDNFDKKEKNEDNVDIFNKKHVIKMKRQNVDCMECLK